VPFADYRVLFEHSPNAYMVLDRDLRYVAANPAYLRATGSRLDDLLGHVIFDRFPHDPRDPSNASAHRLRASFEKVLRTGQPDVLPYIPYRLPTDPAGATDETMRVWSATHSPIFDERGEVAYILQHTVDVTELLQHAEEQAGEPGVLPLQLRAGVLGRARRVEEANAFLLAEREHLRRLFAQAPGFMCFLRGREYVFELANSAYVALVGHRDILGKPLVEALPEMRGQGFVEILDRVMREATPFVGREMRVLLQRQPEGPPEERFLDFVYQPIVDATGTVIGVVTQGYDVTRQRRLQAELATLLERERDSRRLAEAAERRVRFLAEAIPQHVWTATPDGAFDFVNGQLARYFGVSDAALIGSGWLGRVHPDDLGEAAARWARSLVVGAPYEIELRLARADGAHRWHLVRAIPFRDAEGRIAKWFGTNTDTHELKIARDELQKRAEFDQQLIGIVSHDLRDPLNAISMATALLQKRGPLDEQQGRVVARMVSASERAARLIRDFLDFTRVRTSGHIRVTPTEVDLASLAQHVLADLQLAWPGRLVRLDGHGDVTGRWDADRLAQLMGNLLGNAFQHGDPAGMVTLRTDADEAWATITVHNDGSPIPESDRAHLFEPFRRGQTASDAGATRSVGLGLYIARQIALAHGGSIDVASSQAAGTTFTVRLPRHAATAAPLERAASRSGLRA
jgi:PAS domain S-box-containing protein